jgi:hypothetical protein
MPLGSHNWQTIPSCVSSWLEDVKRDLETPDLWAEIQRGAQLFITTSDDVAENAPFTPGEQTEIAERLQELVEQVKRTHSLSAAQMQVLDGKLNYLVKATGRLGRIDWLNACAGALLGYMLAVSLPPEAARDMFIGFLPAIEHLYRLP